MTEPTVAICICTRNRPLELKRALDSIPSSEVAVHQVVVADDGTDGSTVDLLAEYPEVELVQGPRRGLGANRNAAIRSLRTSHLTFLDDDAELDRHFLTHALCCLEARGGGRVIVTGRELKDGIAVSPNDLTFLGFQSRPYAVDQSLTTIVINSTLFPISVFEQIRFDQQLVYGYDETDIAARAVGTGYKIVFCPDAANRHTPSAAARSTYPAYVDASRLYSTWKRYDRVEGGRIKGLVFLLVGSSHHLAVGLHRDGLAGVRRSMRSIGLAVTYIYKLLRDPDLDRCRRETS